MINRKKIFAPFFSHFHTFWKGGGTEEKGEARKPFRSAGAGGCL
jgi:hypothetical protein